ncbi:MAG: hypothetical protein RR853_08445 [Aurantimicrobium sp.]|uniref:hypothetical protein n=1 Tax=Aurantimicrobium TaxID=1705353 RepID=UPI0024740E85|nr:hypothetical protein [Aurantimicrobium minutum]MDH6206902.1 hypothetical protein [Aurantimicrobium minutum]MDH6255635.1 hypothetical protein [Aurantimicrobium minutum]MDH6410145.1 hypothetical protein [Aurantimicrobium minutum]
MDDETLDAVGKISHTYLFVLHDGEAVHRNIAVKMVAEELGLIDENTKKEIVELAQEKLMLFLDVLLESGFLLSRPQKTVMIAPKGLEALIDNEGTFSKDFLAEHIPQLLSVEL